MEIKGKSMIDSYENILLAKRGTPAGMSTTQSVYAVAGQGLEHQDNEDSDGIQIRVKKFKY